jgi:hypothetical protein
MFKKNTQHRQLALISNITDLPKRHRQRLEASWAGTFYHEFFCRIDEEPFAMLYADVPSRPNVPVNVLVGLETLKAGFGWSDEQMYDEFLFNVQVRYALGLQQLGQDDFDIRSVYNFRSRVAQHMQETGENLIEKTFEQVTDEQIQAYKLKTGKLRMDSTQIASNIREMSRLQLLVEVLQRVQRMLKPAEEAEYEEAFSPYLKGSSGQYVYHVKAGESEEHLQAIGELMDTLVEELADIYEHEPAYRVLERVFSEHFVVAEDLPLTAEDKQVRSRKGEDLSANSLQSPDDWEATYRKKRGEGHIGYVANATETCDPENSLQLIVKVQVEPNTTDDASMLEEALPELKTRTGVKEMCNDGGFNSPDVDVAMQEHQVVQIQTAIRGAKPSSEKLPLEKFEWEIDDEWKPEWVTCPGGQKVAVASGRKEGRYLAYFKQSVCDDCSLATKCPADTLKRKPQRALRFSQQQVNVARRRKRSAEARASGQNLRAAVEATMRSIKHPFRNGKVPVRGHPRVSMVLIGSAAMSNVRSIQRHQEAKRKEIEETVEVWEKALERAKKYLDSSLSFFVSRFFRLLYLPQSIQTSAF